MVSSWFPTSYVTTCWLMLGCGFTLGLMTSLIKELF